MMDEIIDFKIKKRVGERAFYATIFLKANKIEHEEGVEIRFDSDVGEFKSSIVFGVNYFYDSFRRLGNHGKLKITIVKFHWMEVDTNHVSAAYATVGALSKALSVTIDGLGIDEKSSSFTFPMI